VACQPQRSSGHVPVPDGTQIETCVCRVGGSVYLHQLRQGSGCRYIVLRASSETSPTLPACPRSPTQLLCGWKLFFLCPRELYFLLVFFVCCLDESSSVPTAYSRALQRIWPTHVALLQGTALEETRRWTQHLFGLVTVRASSPNPSPQPCCADNARAPGENKSSP